MAFHIGFSVSHQRRDQLGKVDFLVLVDAGRYRRDSLQPKRLFEGGFDIGLLALSLDLLDGLCEVVVVCYRMAVVVRVQDLLDLAVDIRLQVFDTLVDDPEQAGHGLINSDVAKYGLRSSIHSSEHFVLELVYDLLPWLALLCE